MKNKFRFYLTIMVSLIFCSGMFAQKLEDRPIRDCTIAKYTGPEGTTFCDGCTYWANGIVPYEFHANVDAAMQTAMLNAMAVIESVADVDFIPRNGHANYIRVKDDPNVNSSFVGRIGGGQDVKIVSWGSEIIIVHELTHALGFWHEQSRPDRDNFVTINAGNICSGKEHNFDIESSGVTSNIPYDFTSYMHYGDFAFSDCLDPADDCNTGCPGGLVGTTIDVLPAFAQFQNVIGQRDSLSRSDSLMLTFTYPFSDYRFINIEYTGGASLGTHIYNAFDNFTETIIDDVGIPGNSQLWVMPGDYEDAEGTYNKPLVVRAPYGGVVLK